MQCFLWRNLRDSEEPEIYMVTVNNIGIKPAGTIASLWLQKSANVYEKTYPDASYQSKEESCVDDLGLADNGSQGEKQLKEECEEMIAHGKMKVEELLCLEKIIKEDLENLAVPCEEIPKVEDKQNSYKK